MWDFGTVRHATRTIGRGSVRAAGPPLTWENDSRSRADEGYSDSRQRRGGDSVPSPVQSTSQGSVHSYSSSTTAKNDLPSLPQSAKSQTRFEPDTVRNVNVQQVTPPEPRSNSTAGRHPVQREPSDEYDEDYDDQYDDNYTAKLSNVQEKAEEVQIEDDLPDTTMLDTVVLPAIASVSPLLLYRPLSPVSDTLYSSSRVFQHKKRV